MDHAGCIGRVSLGRMPPRSEADADGPRLRTDPRHEAWGLPGAVMRCEASSAGRMGAQQHELPAGLTRAPGSGGQAEAGNTGARGAALMSCGKGCGRSILSCRSSIAMGRGREPCCSPSRVSRLPRSVHDGCPPQPGGAVCASAASAQRVHVPGPRWWAVSVRRDSPLVGCACGCDPELCGNVRPLWRSPAEHSGLPIASGAARGTGAARQGGCRLTTRPARGG